MTDQSENQTSITVTSDVKHSHLQGTWIGLEAAIEWIVFREQSMDLDEFERRHDESMRAFINALIDADPEDAANAVQGYRELDVTPSMKTVDPGLWPLTAATELEYDRKKYMLLVIDEMDSDEYEDENARPNWGGQIVGADGFRIGNLRVRCDFILRLWPKSSKRIDARQSRKAFSHAKLERLVRKIYKIAEKVDIDLTQKEVVQLVQTNNPEIPRNPIISNCQNITGNSKTGPRGPQMSDRPMKFEKLRQKVLAVQLSN